MSRDLPPETMQFKELVLEKMLVASRGAVSRGAIARFGAQVSHDAAMRQIMDPLADRLIYELSTYVLTDQLVTDDQEIAFTVDVPVELEAPAPRHWLLPTFAVVLIVTAMGAIAQALLLFIAAWLFVAVVLGVYALNRPQTLTTTAAAHGTVTMRAKYFVAFPENDTIYPDHLGRQVRMMQVEPPEVDVHWKGQW